MKRDLIIALDNSDRGYEIIPDLLHEPGNLMKGIKKIQKREDIAQTYFYIPEAVREESAVKPLEQAGTEIIYGMVDARKAKDQALVVHPEAVLAEALPKAEESLRRLVIMADGGRAVRKLPAECTLQEAAAVVYGEAADTYKAWRAGEHCLRSSELGAIKVHALKSACLIPIEPDDCMVVNAGEQAEYLYRNTCGKCTFCREGAYQIRTVLRDIALGKGQAEDPAYIMELAREAGAGTMCTFGQQGFRFIEECVRKFEKDYIEHIKYQNCPQEVCKSFTDISIRGDRCTGCGTCAKQCPVNAVFGAEGYIHFIDTYDCTQCEECIAVCPEGAIQKVTRGRRLGPLQIVPVGRYRTIRKDYMKKEGTAC